MHPRINEITLLTYEWEPMQLWWSALLGVEPRTVTLRTAVLETTDMRVVIERSEIAMNANPEVAGIISLTLSAPDSRSALAIHNRLAAIGSRHHRATEDAGGVRLWFRDPNGTDVALRLPFDVAPGYRPGREIDPDQIVVRLRATAAGLALPSD